MRIAIVEGTRDEIRDVLRDFRDQVDSIYQKTINDPLPESKVLDVVSKVMNVTPMELMGRSANREAAYVRHLSWYLLRRESSMAVGKIATLFERDHSTVVEGIRRIEMEIQMRPETAAALKRCKEAMA